MNLGSKLRERVVRLEKTVAAVERDNAVESESVRSLIDFIELLERWPPEWLLRDGLPLPPAEAAIETAKCAEVARQFHAGEIAPTRDAVIGALPEAVLECLAYENFRRREAAERLGALTAKR